MISASDLSRLIAAATPSDGADAHRVAIDAMGLRVYLQAHAPEIAALVEIAEAARALHAAKGVVHFSAERTITGRFVGDRFEEDPPPPMTCESDCHGCALDAALAKRDRGTG
jgi:hypothetical protein